MEPDELAGLACEEFVESRLITSGGEGSGKLALEHGPLSAERFEALGEDPWTLLVQAVDHHIPAVSELMSTFSFIPNWRMDDVMVSYATDRGGVGAHFDQYDVFLIQGLGRRHWELGDLCDDDTALLPHDDLRLLADFEAQQQWILEPGDILYVPPGIAHRGTAIGHDCMTYSVGMRAPSRHDLIEGWTEHLLDQVSEADRYADPDLTVQANPGEISNQALARLHRMIAETLADKDAFAHWFGQYATSPKSAEIDWRPEQAFSPDQIKHALRSGMSIVRNPASRFAFVRQGINTLRLFVDGELTECSGETAAFAEALCASQCIDTTRIKTEKESTLHLIKDLVDRGCIAFEGSQD